jgi:hypothetical protein
MSNRLLVNGRRKKKKIKVTSAGNSGGRKKYGRKENDE